MVHDDFYNLKNFVILNAKRKILLKGKQNKKVYNRFFKLKIEDISYFHDLGLYFQEAHLKDREQAFAWAV